MKHEIFGELTFQVGWKTNRKIKISGKDYQINLKIKAYFEEEGITSEQVKNYEQFLKTEENTMDKVAKLLNESNIEIGKRYIPRTLLIDRDGAMAILCDDEEEPDEGIAVCISPQIKIVSQDEYL